MYAQNFLLNLIKLIKDILSAVKETMRPFKLQTQ